MKINKHEILVCIKDCLMRNDNRSTLTIGKEYTIEDFDGEDFMIIDDEEDFHWFPIEEVNLYFTINQ